jgi:hypothetical protein
MEDVNSFLEYYAQIQRLILRAKTKDQLIQSIVDAPFHDKLHTTSLDLGIIVLVLVNPDTQIIERKSYSNTIPAIDAVKASPKKFHDIKIPLKNSENITAKAIRNNKPYKTSDWRYLFTPELGHEAARFKQAEAGMGCSYVYPLIGSASRGALIYSFYQTIDMIRAEHQAFMKNYADFVTLQLNELP